MIYDTKLDQSSSYDDSDSEISSADKEISWVSEISDVAANNFSSTPTIEEEPTVREAMSSWAVTYLASFGGDSVSSFADRIFFALFADEVTYTLTFYGRHQDQKAFLASPLYAVMLAIIHLSLISRQSPHRNRLRSHLIGSTYPFDSTADFSTSVE
ncbi:unnamed protein product [Schistocephalus solidus]|uniref:ABC2_membrane_7 domain-containing protein n=1 Tax=Schistocephalus solidus TaxID=70667 RepID=A0A183S816_SCHSO|nr:unnamed protein product [Schistocephalus solidus]